MLEYSLTTSRVTMTASGGRGLYVRFHCSIIWRKWVVSGMKEGRLCTTGWRQWSTSFESFSVGPFTPDTTGRPIFVLVYFGQLVKIMHSDAACVYQAPCIAVVINNSIVVKSLEERVWMFCYISCWVLSQSLVTVQIVKLPKSFFLVVFKVLDNHCSALVHWWATYLSVPDQLL